MVDPLQVAQDIPFDEDNNEADTRANIHHLPSTFHK